MSQIYDLPDEPMTAGTGFDYTQWNGKTSYASLHRVPWSNDYRDIAYFPNIDDLNTYLDTTRSYENFDFSYLKYNQPVKISVPFNKVIEFNYLRVWNPQQPTGLADSARWLYYFINDVVYVSPDTTQLVLQVDVVQTFMRDIFFGQAYVEQGHVGIAQTGVQPGKPGVLLNPEGLNLGADYQPISNMRMSLAENDTYKVMVMSTVDLGGNHGTVEDPHLFTASGSDFQNLPNGANIYIFDSAADLKKYLAAMQDKPWVTQGIVSITAIPTQIIGGGSSGVVQLAGGVEVLKPHKDTKLFHRVVEMVSDFESRVMRHVGDRYKHLKKFTVYPYSFIELSTYTGEPLVLKPELWADDKKRIAIQYHIAPPSPRVGMRPLNYGSTYPVQESEEISDEMDPISEGWNVATWIANFPQFSVVNNGYLTTMASQAHSIQQSYKDAGWQQQRAMAGNQLAYDQATAGMNLANDLTQNQVTHMQDQTSLSNRTTAMQGGLSAISSVAGGLAGGNPASLAGGLASAITQGASTAININQQTQSSAMQQRLATQQNAAQVANTGYVRDTNKNYADYATKGDYQNAINTINAKVEDAKLTQPSTSGTIGGDAFQLAMRGWYVEAKIKTPPKNALTVIGEYWLRYGYTISRFVTMPQDLRVMSIFSYWKLKETYILDARCPEPIKQAIRGIFEKGVTVWHDAKRIGDPTALADNTPIMGAYIWGDY